MTNKKVQVRINSYLDEQIKEYAESHSMNKSECIKYILTKFFDEYERKAKITKSKIKNN